MIYTAKKSGGYRKRRTVRKKLGTFLIITAVIGGLGFIGLDMRIRPIITKTSSYQARILAEGIINAAIADTIADENLLYSDLVHITYGENGGISSIEGDMRMINRLKSRAALLINERIKQIEQHNMGIALGTAVGIHMFYGRGPVIPFRAAPKGYAATNIASSFESAGINQTLHRIIMTVSADISAVVPGYTSSVSVTTDFVVAETVIVGTVPEAYTNVVNIPEELVGDINDFGANDYPTR